MYMHVIIHMWITHMHTKYGYTWARLATISNGSFWSNLFGTPKLGLIFYSMEVRDVKIFSLICFTAPKNYWTHKSRARLNVATIKNSCLRKEFYGLLKMDLQCLGVRLPTCFLKFQTSWNEMQTVKNGVSSMLHKEVGTNQVLLLNNAWWILIKAIHCGIKTNEHFSF